MKPYYWALLSAVVWGCAPIFEKLGLSKIPVFPGLYYRCLGVIFGTILLVVLNFDAIKGSIVQLSPGWWYLAAGGFLASIVGQIFFYHALKDGKASLVVPIAATYPLISFLLGILFLGEKFTIAKSCGLGFVLIGVFLLK